CCEPVVTSTREAGMRAPPRLSRSAIHSRSGPKPSVGPYWSAACGASRSTFAVASRMRSTGKVAGDGRPPAKEMTSGRSVTLRISRMAELVSAWARRDRVNEVAMAKCTGPPCDRKCSGGPARCSCRSGLLARHGRKAGHGVDVARRALGGGGQLEPGTRHPLAIVDVQLAGACTDLLASGGHHAV